MKRFYYFITLYLLILSARASVISATDIFWFVFELILLFVALRRKLFTRKEIKVLVIFTVLYVGLILFRNLFNKLSGEYISSDLIFLGKFLYGTFLYCIVLKEKALPYIIKVVTHLAVLSLILYPVQLADSGIITGIGSIFDLLSLSTHSVVGGYNNFIFFTVYDAHATRNCGFSWEPGAFACILALTMIFALLRNNFKFNKQSYIMGAALITTVSTTGYIMLLIVIILKVLNSKDRAKLVYAIPVLIVLVIIFINSPVLYNKILSAYNSDMQNSTDYDNLQDYYTQTNATIPLNRFASFIQIFITFKYQLLLGVGNKYSQILDKDYSFNISNGIADFLARFGLLGMILYMRYYLKYISRYTKLTLNKVLIVIFLLALFFGEPLLSIPLFMFFAIYPMLYSEKSMIKNDQQALKSEKKLIQQVNN